MRQLEAALRQLAERAEPLPTEVLIARIETELGWAGATPAVAETEEPTMVTHQQQNIETPTPTPPPRSRRGPLLAAAVAVVVILAGVGIAFASGAFEPGPTAAEQHAVATELVETWGQGWEDGNPELVVSVFTDDGVYTDPRAGGDVAMTMENMENTMVSRGCCFTSVDRVSDLSPSGDNTYTWVQEFDHSERRYRGDMEIELEGDLAKRIAWLGYGYREIGPASDS